jgi:hypothetical protein
MSKRPFDFEDAVEFYTNTNETDETNETNDSTTNAQQPVKKKKVYKKCEHGKQKARCKQCGGSQICEHGKNKTLCKQCGGSAYCEHDKLKQQCKECGGSAYCEHGKYKPRCKQCNGSQICEHNKRKSRCKTCGGSELCEHGKQKRQCKQCGGSAYCEHNKVKYFCKQCGGSALCEHGKFKTICKTCGGSEICEHNRRKPQCKECGGSAYCEHDKRKIYCKQCSGSAYCVHKKRKTRCKQCGGSALCKNEWCETNKSKDGYCTYCYTQMFPDAPLSRNYKTKEKSVSDFVLDEFPNFTWSVDRRIENGCSRRRPDLMLDLGSHVIIVEIDENQHIDYDCSCENKRIMEISQDVTHRPIVFIRFNPDEYIDYDGNQVTSCWKINKTSGILVLNKTKVSEWNTRLESLREQIQYWIDNVSEKTIEVVQLFYDCN